MKHSTAVKNYYENNTKKFLQFGRTAATKSIHQPLWKSPNFTKTEALFYANDLVLKVLKNYPIQTNLNIIDLGCGVGSSLFYLANQLGSRASYYGVSISSTQVNLANESVKQFTNNENRPLNFSFIEADFTHLPSNIPPIDLAFSIEAFAHASAPEKYFKQISQYLKEGSHLVLIDDFLNGAIDVEQLDLKTKQALADFKYGWMVNSLKTQQELSSIGEQFGLKLIEVEDLTPYMRNNTIKHQWIRLLVHSFRWLYELMPTKSPYFRSWIGGKGKQYCLKKGVVKYKKMVFEKVNRK